MACGMLYGSHGLLATKWRIAALVAAVHAVLDHADNLLGELAITELSVRLEPRERPVDHAEHHHGERGLVFLGRPLRVGARELPGERRDDAALAFEHDFTLRVLEVFHIVDQRAVPAMRRFVFGEERADQFG